MYRLVYSHDGESREFLLLKDHITIGRMVDNDIVLSDHTISRRHAELFKTPDGWKIVDQGSRNGTRVNDAPVKEALLNPGDVVTLGMYALRFEAEMSEKVMIATTEDASVPEGTIIRSVDEIESQLSAGRMDKKAALGTADIDRLARTSHILAVLSEVGRTLLSTADIEGLLEKIMDVIFQYVHAQRGVILLCNPKTGDLEPRTVRESGGGRDTIQISRTIAKKAFEEGVAILCQDAQVDPRFKAGESIRFLGIRSALCVPLKVEDKVLGLLYVDTPVKVKAYEDFDLELLTALAGYAALGIQQAQLRAAIEEERRAKARLERYHSPSVVSRIMEAGDASESLTLEVRELVATVLFSDLVGFTTLTEHMPPHDVARMLNTYFSRMTDILFANEGTLDKFMGDAIMAIFGAPIDSEDHARRAVMCALEMKQALRELNDENSDQRPLRFRIGINTGPVVAGDIGSIRRMEYTVLGTTVNVASRLESEVAEPGQIIVGEQTYEAIRDEFEFERIGKVKVKGLSQPITVYEVKRPRNDDTSH